MRTLAHQERTTLDFATDGLQAVVIHDAVECEVVGAAIVMNLGSSDAVIHGDHITRVPPLQSAMVVDAQLSGQCVAVFQTSSSDSVIADARREWQDFYGSRGAPAGHPELLKSPQSAVGTVALNKAALLRQPDLPDALTDFDVRLNLWFSPAGTACGIHNEHDFIEVHTQLAGVGRMQKFRVKSADSLYEEYVLSEGNTNPPTFCHEHLSKFKYPWHQYFADTDCVWLAVEYHPV